MRERDPFKVPPPAGIPPGDITDAQRIWEGESGLVGPCPNAIEDPILQMLTNLVHPEESDVVH